jgi:hypothetical protein
MSNSSLGRRLDLALLALSLASQGEAVQYDREIVSSSVDVRKEPPRPDLDVERWSLRAERLVEALEHVAAGTTLNPEMPVSQLKKVMRQYAGRASGFVAFAECTTVDRVVQARTALGVDPETGLPKPKPLTSRELPGSSSCG